MARSGKVAVIGAGFYGSTTAMRLAEYDIFDTVVLTETRAKSVGDNASVVTFTVSCTLSDATGGKP